MQLHEPWLGFVVSSIGAQKVKKDTSVQPAFKHMLWGENMLVMVACLLLVCGLYIWFVLNMQTL